MQLIDTVAELQQLADKERLAGRRIALVPTMGALHDGHLSLVAAGRARAERVWVSIFVNPTQFNDPADLDRYPRTLAADLAACEAAGVDAVFLPDACEMYPDGNQTAVVVSGLTEPLCGRARPGHFGGVTTVVAKLLLAAKPHFAVFGEKDYQQLAVVRRMARDLCCDVEIVGAPTVREPDGLAMSSRNQNLDPEARRQAVVLSRALAAVAGAVGAGETGREALLALARRELAAAPLARIDYAELRDAETLAPAAERLDGATVLAVAVYFEPGDPELGTRVRLIDNCTLHPQPIHEDRRS